MPAEIAPCSRILQQFVVLQGAHETSWLECLCLNLRFRRTRMPGLACNA